MKKLRLILILLSASLLCVLPASAMDCDQLVGLQYPGTTINHAEMVTSGTFTPPGKKAIGNLPGFCRVEAVLRPSSDSDIRVELWMPQADWNGRLEGTGNGGFAGSIQYKALAEGLRRGYAVVNTDMGMSVPEGSDPSIFVNHPERWTDWGYRSTHEMTVFAKRVVMAYYRHDPKKSYFVGCSTGGGQALMEAQRFPADYDGIVGGAPANNRTGVHVSILWNFAVAQRNPASYIAPAGLQMVAKAVLSACGGQDGLQDGVVADPQACYFDPATIECKGGNTEDCLTPQQVDAVRLLYAGPVDPRTRQSLYPGLSPGSEGAWNYYFGDAPQSGKAAPFAPIFEWVFGTNWDWRNFDFDRDAVTFDNRLAASLNATSPDLDRFRDLGHKLLIYHGWADPLVASEESVDYWNSVQDRYRRLDVKSDVDDFYRLFMIPGMRHCEDGPGANHFDPLSAVVNWVENGEAPDRMIATKFRNDRPEDGILFQRPLCPYPQIAYYRGSGPANDASSFVCTEPGQQDRQRKAP